jgi:hypothetical protein
MTSPGKDHDLEPLPRALLAKRNHMIELSSSSQVEAKRMAFVSAQAGFMV